MAWPFTSPASGPTNFAALGSVVPQVDTEIAAGAAVWLLGAHFINNGAVDRTVTLKNSAGSVLWKETIPPGSGSEPYSPTFEPSVGLKWIVDGGTDVIGHVWGY